MFGQEQKLSLRRFCTVGIVQKNTTDNQQSTKLNNKHHYNIMPFAPTMAWDIWIHPIQRMEPLTKGSVKGTWAEFSIHRCATTDLTMRNQTCESQAVSMAVAMQWYTMLCPSRDADGAHPGLHWKPLDAAIR